MERRAYKVVWLTAAPSPQQRDLLQAIARHPSIELEVLFCARRLVGRPEDWSKEIGDFKYRILAGVRVSTYWVNPGIIKVCAKSKCDLFIVTSYSQPTMQLAMMVLTVLGKRWALWGERPGINRKSRWRNAVREIGLWLPKHFAFCGIGTGSLAQVAFHNLFGDGRPTYSLPYVVSLDRFLELPVAEATGEQVRFLFVGQLIRRKGVDVLCQAARKLFQEGTPAMLIVAGDGQERWRIERLIEEFPKQVKWLGGVPFSERCEVYGTAEVFVLPSRHDGWGVVVHEAMARGMPVISCRSVGSVWDLVVDGVNGLIVTTGSSDELYRAMLFFVESREEIRRFGERARAKASRLTPEWGAERLVQILRDAEGTRLERE